MSETSKAYKTLVDDLVKRGEAGDTLAVRCLSAMSLLCEGWRYGDPDPTDPPPSNGGEPVNLAAYRLRLAA